MQIISSEEDFNEIITSQKAKKRKQTGKGGKYEYDISTLRRRMDFVSRINTIKKSFGDEDEDDEDDEPRGRQSLQNVDDEEDDDNDEAEVCEQCGKKFDECLCEICEECGELIQKCTCVE
jgi:hypothetical protein